MAYFEADARKWMMEKIQLTAGKENIVLATLDLYNYEGKIALSNGEKELFFNAKEEVSMPECIGSWSIMKTSDAVKAVCKGSCEPLCIQFEYGANVGLHVDQVQDPFSLRYRNVNTCIIGSDSVMVMQYFNRK